MAINSYQGISSLQGVNSFGGGNGFQAPADSRNIQASQIQDTGLRSLLQDQFKPVNSYSKLQVAPLGQVKSMADQYQTLDQSKLDDPTRQFLQPYLTGKTSSLDPTKSFIHRDQLTSAQGAMEAQNAAQKADYDRRLAAYNAQLATPSKVPQSPVSQVSIKGLPGKFSGFTPGQDNGDWRWSEGAGPKLVNIELQFMLDQAKRSDVDEWGNPVSWGTDEYGNKLSRPISEDEKRAQQYLDTVSPKGSGTWYNDKDPYHGIDYRPGQGYRWTQYDSPKKGMGKIMPMLTMAALGAMTGGAGAALGGTAGSAGAIAGQAIGAAIPSTVSTGLQTGDWGKALGTGAVSALGSGLAGAYGAPLGSSLGLEGQLAKSVGSGLIGGGVNSLGQIFQGKSAGDALRSGLGGALTGAGGSYIGSQLSGVLGGGTLGNISGKALGSAAGGGLNALLNKGDIGQALVNNLIGGTVSGGLGAVGNYLGGGSQLGSMLAGAGTSAAKAYANNELAKRLKRKSNV